MAPVPACGLELGGRLRRFPRDIAAYGRKRGTEDYKCELVSSRAARLREGAITPSPSPAVSPKRMPKTVQLQNGIVPALRNLFGSPVIIDYSELSCRCRLTERLHTAASSFMMSNTCIVL